MIKEVTYYQAQCDVCGYIDAEGEFSAWMDPDQARMTAVDANWIEIEVQAHSTAEGGHIYIVKREGQAPYRERSILICYAHDGAGIHWCATCEDDLDESKWTLWPTGNRISQTCQNRHENRIDLLPVGGESDGEQAE